MSYIQIKSVEIKKHAVLIEGIDLDSIWMVDNLDEQTEAKTLKFKFDLESKGHSKYLFTVVSNNRKASAGKTTREKIMALNGQTLTLNDNFRVKQA